MAAALTQDDLARLLSARAGIPLYAARRRIAAAVQQLETPGSKLKQRHIASLGTLRVGRRGPSQARHPESGELVEVPGGEALVFLPDRGVAKALRRPTGRPVEVMEAYRVRFEHVRRLELEHVPRFRSLGRGLDMMIGGPPPPGPWPVPRPYPPKGRSGGESAEI